MAALILELLCRHQFAAALTKSDVLKEINVALRSGSTFLPHGREQCVEASGGSSRRVLFFKTHKTASSTITGLLWRRLCLELHFNCFLPPAHWAGRTWDLSNPRDRAYVHSSLGTNHSLAPFQAWVHHLRYSASIGDLVQQPYVLVSSVRRPAARFISAWYWYSLNATIDMTLQTFAREYNTSTRSDHLKWKYRTGLDSTSQELTGQSPQSNTFRRAFTAHLLRKVAGLQLYFMVAERFDESVLVLRRLLGLHCSESGWSSWDYLPQKVRNVEDGGDAVLQDWELDRLDALQPYDTALYAAANHVLDWLIEWYGPSFPQDLREYQTRLQHVREDCAMPLSPSHSAAVHPCKALRADNREAVAAAWGRVRGAARGGKESPASSPGIE